MIRAVLLVLLMFACSARAAEASWLGFYEYLEQLSGPGPFRIGFGVDVPIYCDDAQVSIKCFGPPDPLQKKQRRFEIAPHFAWLKAEGPGELTYIGTPPDVQLYMFGATGTLWFQNYRPGTLRDDGVRAKRLQLGVVARVSALHFTGNNVSADDAIVRFGPIVTFPVAGDRLRLFVSPQVQIGLGPFDREAFGAAPGDRLEEPTTVHVQFGVTF